METFPRLSAVKNLLMRVLIVRARQSMLGL